MSPRRAWSGTFLHAVRGLRACHTENGYSSDGGVDFTRDADLAGGVVDGDLEGVEDGGEVIVGLDGLVFGEVGGKVGEVGVLGPGVLTGVGLTTTGVFEPPPPKAPKAKASPTPAPVRTRIASMPPPASTYQRVKNGLSLAVAAFFGAGWP